jgi:hypothetical protein
MRLDRAAEVQAPGTAHVRQFNLATVDNHDRISGPGQGLFPPGGSYTQGPRKPRMCEHTTATSTEKQVEYRELDFLGLPGYDGVASSSATWRRRRRGKSRRGGRCRWVGCGSPRRPGLWRAASNRSQVLSARLTWDFEGKASPTTTPRAINPGRTGGEPCRSRRRTGRVCRR